MAELSQDYAKVESYFHSYHMKECLKQEVQKGTKPFSWWITIKRAIKCRDRRFYFWFRLWRFVYESNKFHLRKFAKHRFQKLNRKHNIDINIGSSIGPGFKIVHFTGIVIRRNCKIGKFAIIRQNVTIGDRNDTETGHASIGDYVEIGANSCIIGNVKIGKNVTIGALSFINKDIPDNTVVYSTNSLIVRDK